MSIVQILVTERRLLKLYNEYSSLSFFFRLRSVTRPYLECLCVPSGFVIWYLILYFVTFFCSCNHLVHIL